MTSREWALLVAIYVPRDQFGGLRPTGGKRFAVASGKNGASGVSRLGCREGLS